MPRLEIEYFDGAASDFEQIYLALRYQGASQRPYGAISNGFVRPASGSATRLRNDLAPGLRLWTFERNTVIAYKIGGRSVMIVNVFRRGRDIAAYYSTRDG